eukprot:scaffold7670_cov120-Skeletonema_marinoi.AAC.3
MEKNGAIIHIITVKEVTSRWLGVALAGLLFYESIRINSLVDLAALAGCLIFSGCELLVVG